MDYAPLLKNAALSALAGFTVSFAGFLAFTDSTDLPALKAAGLSAVYAACRAFGGYVKARVSDPFAVDTEAKKPSVDVAVNV